jgi:hypothetical protein
MIYLEFDERGVVGLNRESGIVRLLVEADDSGRVTREVGIDAARRVVHRCPDVDFKHGKYGLFDNVPVQSVSGRNDVSKEEFETVWKSK